LRLYLLPLILFNGNYKIVTSFTLKYLECGEKTEVKAELLKVRNALGIVCLNGWESILTTC
jgi:hypothetical protein